MAFLIFRKAVVISNGCFCIRIISDWINRRFVNYPRQRFKPTLRVNHRLFIVLLQLMLADKTTDFPLDAASGSKVRKPAGFHQQAFCL